MKNELQGEFPIDWTEDNFVSRREFFKFMTLASGGLALGSAGLAAWAQIKRKERHFERMHIARMDEISVGESLQFFYPRPNDICILVHRSPGEFTAFSRRCTHLSCPVNYEHDTKRLFCPCHNGAFSVETGEVLQGPPPHPLPRILLEFEEGMIYAVGVAHDS
jgi:Rieske Fe-S protein